MNLNFSHKNEYSLNKKLINELINTYGIETKLIVCEKNHVDKNVFGDWDSINTKNSNVYCIHLLPENTDDLSSQFPFGDFGFNSLDTTDVFMSAFDFERNNFTTEILLSSLIVLPSNKVMEITNVEHKVPGINNLWGYSDEKSAYKLSLRTYEFKLHDEMDSKLMVSTTSEFSKEFSDDDIESELDEKKESYDALDNYFERLLKTNKDIKYEAEVQDTTSISTERVTKEELKTNRKYDSIVKNDEKDPFGW